MKYLLVCGHIGEMEKIVANTPQASKNLCEWCNDKIFSMAEIQNSYMK